MAPASRPRSPVSRSMHVAFIVILLALVYQSFMMQRLSQRLSALEEGLASVKTRQDTFSGRRNLTLQPAGFPGMGSPGGQEYYPAPSGGRRQRGAGGAADDEAGGTGAADVPSGTQAPAQGEAIPQASTSPQGGTLGAVTPAPASTPVPASVRKASDVVRLLATLIVLEYKPEINLNDKQNAAARAAVAEHVGGRLDRSALRRRVEQQLTTAQRAWLEQERGQIDTKIAELLEMPDKDDKGYAELLMEFLKMPIKPNI